MEQHQIVFISLLIPLIGMPVGLIVVWLTLKQAREERALLNRERMAAIERGLEVPLLDVLAKRRTSPLRSALIVLASGLALSLPVLDSGPGAWMWGFWLALVGLAMLVHWFVAGRREWERDRALDEELRSATIERLRSGPRVTASEAGRGPSVE